MATRVKTVKLRVRIETRNGKYRPYVLYRGVREYPFEGRWFTSKKSVTNALTMAYAVWDYNNGWITVEI